MRRVWVPRGMAPSPGRARSSPLIVPLASVTTIVGFSCAPGGWHPYVETLRQHQKTPGLVYEDSILHALYERYQPRSLHEAVFWPGHPPVRPLDAWPPTLVWHLWTLSHAGLAAALNGDAGVNPDDLLYFGPVDHERYGRRHFERLIAVYESIRSSGYRPDEYRDGLVEGHFLEGEGHYRFVVREGHHRVAALQALGHEHVVVRIWNGLTAVRQRDLARWGEERGGVFSREAVDAIFEHLLHERGDRKAAALDLRQ